MKVACIGIRRSLLALAALLAAGCVGPSAQMPEISSDAEREELQRQNAMAVDAIIEQHQRLLDISWPVTTRGVSICGEDSKLGAGYLTANLGHFPEHLREAASNRYYAKEEGDTEKEGDGKKDANKEDHFVIVGVASQSLAERAGLQTGDLIVSFNGEKFDGENKFRGDGQNNLFVVRRGAETLEISLLAEQMCKYPVGLIFDNQVNAFADGENVIITSGLMRALTDSQVQVVIAHEIAHNLRKHVDAQKTNAVIGTVIDLAVIIGTGVNPGMRNLAVMRYSEDFEAEADYVSMYILAAAGFELEQVPDIWRRMTVLNPAVNQSKASLFGRTHPTNAQRFLALEKTIEEIRAKQASGAPLLPNFKGE